MVDTYVGLVHFTTSPPAAEFKYAYGVYTSCSFKTHFRLNLKSLRSRIANLGLEKNGAPNDLREENKAVSALVHTLRNFSNA